MLARMAKMDTDIQVVPMKNDIIVRNEFCFVFHQINRRSLIDD